jgi:signal transduction histidine kinase
MVLLAGVYLITAKLGLRLAFVNASATAVWAPSGIALAAVVALGPEVWPGVLLGAFLANATTAGTWLTSLGIAVGNTLEALAGAALVARYANGLHAFDRARDVFKFTILTAAVSTTVSATIGVCCLGISGLAPWHDAGAVWLTWWLGDAAGDMIVAPLVLLWLLNPRLNWSPVKIIEAALLALALCTVGAGLFGGIWPAGRDHAPLAFLFLPILMWAAFRFDRRGTATVSCALTAVAVWGTLHGFGPFVRRDPNESLLLLQAFLGVTSITVLAVAALVARQRADEVALAAAHDDLESIVADRTSDLARAITVLQSEIALRAKAESDLQKRTEELAKSNSALEQFATIAAHELQEPLRKIMTFGGLLRSGKDAAVPVDADYALKMEDAAGRMQKLVESLLRLSRVITNAKPLDLVPLSGVVEEVAADFRERYEREGGTIRAGSLPEIRAERLQMRQLFENLFSNSFKFRKKDAPPRLGIACVKQSDGFVKIEVSDNGIGFDPKDAGKIFEPFQRLNRRADYEGSGMGLAICKRVLMRHGGDIEARSAPGEGTTFVITLPV